MGKRKEFEDPLKYIDPVMEEAFSLQEENEKPASKKHSKKEIPSDTEEEIASTHDVAQVQFPSLEPCAGGKKIEEDILGNIPVTISVELGRSEMSLKEIYQLTEGSIIELQRIVGEPLDLIVNGQTIAEGEVVAVDNNYGLRLTNIIAKAK